MGLSSVISSREFRHDRNTVHAMPLRMVRVSCSSCTIISRQLTACGLELGDEKCDMSLESLSMTHPVCAYGNSITEIRMGRDIDRQVNCTIERCQSRDK